MVLGNDGSGLAARLPDARATGKAAVGAVSVLQQPRALAMTPGRLVQAPHGAQPKGPRPPQVQYLDAQRLLQVKPDWSAEPAVEISSGIPEFL